MLIMITLDIRTMWFGGIIINFIAFVVLLQLWVQNRRKYSGLSYWVADYLLQFLGSLLFIMRGIIPDWASIVLANSMVVGGISLLYVGLCRFTGKKSPPRLNFSISSLFCIFVAMHSYFTFVDNDLLARSINVSFCISLICLICIVFVFNRIYSEIRQIAKGLLIALATMILLALIRIGLLISISITTNDYMKSGGFEVVLGFLFHGSNIFIAINLVLMVNKRLFMETEKAMSIIKKNRELLNETGKIAKIGGWDFDVDTLRQNWTEEVYHIHEVDMDYEPTMEKGINFYTPEAIPIISGAVQRAIDYGEPFDLELPFMTAKRNPRWVHSIGKAYREDGKTLSVGGTFQDITKRKQAEEALQNSNAQLENALSQLKKTQAYMIQSEKMAAIGQLAAGVAHEINNPTGFVSSNLNTLSNYQADINRLIEQYRNLASESKKLTAKREETASLSEQVECIQDIESETDMDFVLEDTRNLIKESQEGVERIKRIVDDLKAFAHPGNDKLQSSDINNCLESTLNVVWNELKYKATVIKEYGDLPLINCYPQQLNQVFMNLLVNAAQAIEKQGVIKISSRAYNGNVEIKISDTGSGISQENISKIFDPFFTTKDVGKGTGLGLHITYNIIKKHNGTIDVESTVGKGTTFTIRLPICNA